MKKFTVALLSSFVFSTIFISAAYAKDCQLHISGGDNMKFNVSELKASKTACEKVTVTLKHTGKLPKAAMGHNWVLAKAKNLGDVMNLAKKAMEAGAAKDYRVPDGDVIAQTEMIGGGATTSVSFPMSKLTKGESYMFFCSFPGHASLMKGKFIVE